MISWKILEAKKIPAIKTSKTTKTILRVQGNGNLVLHLLALVTHYIITTMREWEKNVWTYTNSTYRSKYLRRSTLRIPTLLVASMLFSSWCWLVLLHTNSFPFLLSLSLATFLLHSPKWPKMIPTLLRLTHPIHQTLLVWFFAWSSSLIDHHHLHGLTQQLTSQL